MAHTIKPKRTEVPGKVPTTADIAVGEIALNATDGILYIRDSLDNIRAVEPDTSNFLAKTGDTMSGSLTLNNALTNNSTSTLKGNTSVGTSSANSLTVNATTTFNSNTSGLQYGDISGTPSLTGVYAPLDTPSFTGIPKIATGATLAVQSGAELKINAGATLTINGGIKERYRDIGSMHSNQVFDPMDGTIQELTISGSSLGFSGFNNPLPGCAITLIINQNSSGTATLSTVHPTVCYFADGNSQLTPGVGARDLMTILFVGSNTYYISLANDFK